MKINKSILILLLIVFFTFENNICLSQSYDYYKGISQDNNYTQVYPLIELIKNNIAQNDFKSAKNNFNELIKQVESSSISPEDKLKYFDILNVITRRYCHSEQNASKIQTAVLEIKNTYKELYLNDLRFQEGYINSIQSFISVNDRSNVALYGILDLIDIYLGSIQNGDDSKLENLFRLYSSYNNLLITNSTFKSSIHNRLKNTVDLLNKLAEEKDLPTKNTKYLPYLSMVFCYLGDFYLTNATTDDAKKMYYMAYDLSILIYPETHSALPIYHEHLVALDRSFNSIYWKYTMINDPIKSKEVLVKIWDYYFGLLRHKYYKITTLSNYGYFLSGISGYLCNSNQYEKFGNLYTSIRTLSENNPQDFGLSQIQSRYELLCKEGKINPCQASDSKPNNDIAVNNNEISVESAIKYQEESRKYLNYSSSYSNKNIGIDLLKKAEYIYSEINKKEPIDKKNIEAEINLCRQIADQSHNINGNDYIKFYLKAANIAEINKLYSQLADIYKDIAIYYYQRDNKNDLAEKYFDKSIAQFEQSIKNLTKEDKLDKSFLIFYVDARNFYVTHTKNNNKVLKCSARMAELYEKFIYSKNHDFDTTTEFARRRNLYAEDLFALKQYNKSKLLLLQNIKMLNDFKKYKAKANQLATLDYVSTHDLRLLAMIIYLPTPLTRQKRLL